MEPVRFRYDEADYLAANRLHARIQPISVKNICFILFLWMIYTISVVVIGSGGSPSRSSLMITGGSGIALLAVLLALLTQAWQRPHVSRRIFRQQKALHLEMTASWDATHLHMANANGSGQHPWSDFLRWAESGDMLLFYQSEIVFIMLPKRLLSDAQAQDISEILTRLDVARRR